MQHDKLFAVSFRKFLLHQCQQIIIRKILTGSQRIFLDEVTVIGFFSKEVDKRVVVTLIGEESCLETCFFESGNNSFLMIDGIEILCRNGRHEHRNTLMSCIRLGQHIRKSRQAGYLRQFGICLTIITVQRPIERTGSLSHYQYVNLPVFCRMRGGGIESEILRSLFIIESPGIPLHGKHYVIAHIDRI